MTTNNSILTLTVSEDELKKIESFANTLLSMSDSYDLPESVSIVIQDLADESEVVRMRAIMNHHSPIHKQAANS